MLKLNLRSLAVAFIHFSVSTALQLRRRIEADLKQDLAEIRHRVASGQMIVKNLDQIWLEVRRRFAGVRWILTDLEQDWTELRRVASDFVEFLAGRKGFSLLQSIEKDEKEYVVETTGAEAGAEVTTDAAVSRRRDLDGGELVSRCDVCGEVPIRRCSRFRGTYYCSGKCLIIHWGGGHGHGYVLSRVEDHPIVVSDGRPGLSLDNVSTAVSEDGTRPNLVYVSNAQEVESSSDPDSCRSKFEELNKIFDEIEASLSASKIEKDKHHSANKPSFFNSSLNVANEIIVGTGSSIENPSHEGFKVLLPKLDQLITEMDSLGLRLEF